MLSASDERQLLRASIPYVRRDVPAVLPHPPEWYGRSVAITRSPQRNDKRCRHQQLEQCAAQEHQGLAIEAEYQMAGFMYREVETVDPAVFARVSEAGKAVNQQDRRECGAPTPVVD